MKVNPRDIIIAPIISEKSHSDLVDNKYQFRVAVNATKTDVEKAVHEIFNVEVDKVNMMNKSGKTKSFGRFHGKASSWKKAIVTVRQGQKIEGFFEGM